LTICDSIVLYAGKVIIPPALIQDVLSALHHGHLGATRMALYDTESVFWPNMVMDMTNKYGAYYQCRPPLALA
jgi:hypothetical protein